MDGLLDMLKNGDAHIVGIGILEDCGDCSEDCDESCTKEDKERFKVLVDGLICRLLHDNDSACCIFQTWRAERHSINRISERVDYGIMTDEEAEKKIKLIHHSLALFERTFMNALLGEHYDLIEPMPLRSDEVNEIIKQRFERNYSMIEDEE